MLAYNNRAIAAQQNPQELVRSFYIWYIEENKDLGNVPIKNDEMYKYVYPCTVKKLRIDMKQSKLNGDHFLRGNDFSYEDFKKSLTVHAPVSISDSIALVPVGVGFTDKLRIVVFLQKTTEGWRIIKVESIYY
jgi:hypothetical protein